MNRAIVRMSGLAGVLCAGPILFSPAVGAEFSWQVSGSYRDDADSNILESNRSALTATWYFSPVDDDTGPYELAPFLSRASRVTVDLAQTKLRERIMPTIRVSEVPGDFMLPEGFVPFEGTPALLGIPSEAGIDTSEYAVYGRYVWPGSGWYAGARAERGDVDPWPQVWFVEEKLALQGTGLFAGKYFGSRTAVELGFGSRTLSQEVRPRTDFLEGAFGFTDPIVLLSGATDLPLGLIPLSEPESPFIQTHRSERESHYGLSGALFPTDALGVRLAYSRSDEELFGSRDLVGVSATWFFVRKAAAEIEWARTRNDRSAGSRARDSVFVRLLGRF